MICASFLKVHLRKKSIHAVAIAGAATMIFVSGCSSTPSQIDLAHSWSTPVRIEPAGLSSDYSSLYGVSCASSTFCAAVDESGSALFWRSGKWSSPQTVWAGGTLNSVSCPTTTFCMAMSAGGNAVNYNGQSWSTPVTVGPSATYEVSCPTVTFCATAAASGTPGAPSTVGTFNGGSWSTFQTSTTGALNDRILDVSCATPTFCVAVNLDGHAIIFDGTGWSTSRATGVKGLVSVSCPSASFCMAVATSGSSVTFDGTSWSISGAMPGFQAGFVRSVSCASATTCTALGLSGLAADWHQGRWTTPVLVFPGGYMATVSVSCATSSSCVAVNSKGSAATR